MRPEAETQDVALECQQVVADVQPAHRGQMRAHDAVDDDCGHVGRHVSAGPGRIAAMLEIVQGRGADRQPFLVACVPFGDARVEIPAVVVETRRVGEVPDLLETAVFQFAEADDDVGDLDAGIVDVVLHFDRRAAEGEGANQRVAERRVAQVADVRRLVRIDRRVLDDGLASLAGLAVFSVSSPRSVPSAGSAGAMSPRKRAIRNAGRSRNTFR